MRDPRPCAVCGVETENRLDTLYLCYEHAAVAARLAKVLDAKTPFDLIAAVAHGKRQDPDNRPTTYQLAPDADIERAVRDVDVTRGAGVRG